MARKRRKKQLSQEKISNTIKVSTVQDAATPDGFASPEKTAIIPKTIPSPSKVYTSNIGRGSNHQLRWEPPEWDLVEPGRILDTEGLVRRAFRVKKNLFTKEGYEFIGRDVNRTRYIKRRFQQMERATGIPFPVLISQTVSALIRCSNAFWVKKRDTNASGGKVRKVGNKTLKPVAGYFPVGPEDIRFKRDEFGKVVKIEQCVYGKEPVEFLPEDVVHFFFDKREGFSVGTPLLAPVADDIRALRRIEENVELLVYQHLFPLFHYQVGTPEAPAAVLPDGSSEVDIVTTKVAQMPSDGCWVTPERHKVTALKVGSPPVPIDAVIEHFKRRIYIGLGVSSVDMGEGDSSNRSTAQTMSRNLIDDTKSDQKDFGAQFYHFVITELLLESTFPESTLFDEENRVYLKFKEIDNEARQAKENHTVNMFLQNAITHDEMREQLGYEPFTGSGWVSGQNGGEGFSRTQYAIFQRDQVILQSVDEPGTDEAKSVSKAAANKTTSNNNQPQNQHGTRASAKLNKDSFEPLSHIPSLDHIFLRVPPIQTKHRELRDMVAKMVADGGIRMGAIESSISSAFSLAKESLIVLTKQSYRAGLRDTNHFVWEVKIDNIDQRIHRHIEKYVNKFVSDLLNRIEYNTSRDMALRNSDSLVVKSVFDVMEHRTKMIDKSEILRAYNYGLASGYRLNGFKEIRSFAHGSGACSKCKDEFLKYNYTDAIIYEELPPLHPLCACTMVVVE